MSLISPSAVHHPPAGTQGLHHLLTLCNRCIFVRKKCVGSTLRSNIKMILSCIKVTVAKIQCTVPFKSFPKIVTDSTVCLKTQWPEIEPLPEST